MTAAFLTPLDVRIVDDCGPRPSLMTIAPLCYESDIVGKLEVPAGYIFDGASVPRAAMSITGWPAVRAACLHDHLLSIGVERRVADHVFGEALAVCGVDEGTAQIMYEAVRMYSRLLEAHDGNDQDAERGPHSGA